MTPTLQQIAAEAADARGRLTERLAHLAGLCEQHAAEPESAPAVTDLVLVLRSLDTISALATE